jgi:lipopolysaccharide export system protein LptA
MMILCRAVISSISILLLLAASAPAAPAPASTAASEVGGAPAASKIVVHSDSLEVNDKDKTVIFRGHVDAKKDTFVIHCEEMRLFYLNDGASKGKEQDIIIDRIEAKGGVRIIRTDGASATADTAVYFHSEEKVILTGEPVIRQGEDIVQGSRIILYLKDKRSIVEGSQGAKVKAVLSPRTESR